MWGIIKGVKNAKLWDIVKESTAAVEEECKEYKE